MIKTLRRVMMPEVTEQDIEKGEKSTTPESTKEDAEKTEQSSTCTPQVTVPDEAECSTKPEITEQDDDEELKETLENMKTLIETGAESPKLLRKGERSCSIFRISKSLTKIHHKGYEPQIVSIGPYHHEKEHLQMIEEHKYRFLQLFLGEANDGVTIELLGKKILKVETAIRSSYSEKLVGFDQPKLLKMMLLDGCFILMLFFFIARNVDAREKSPHDPILTTPWILESIRSDLLLLENQVPFILLKALLEESKLSFRHAGYLEYLALKFFRLVKKEGSRNLDEAKHLLDLVRKTFIPVLSSHDSVHSHTKKSSSSHQYSRLILSATRLRLQGIEFKTSHDHSSSKVCRKKLIDYIFKESNAFVPSSSQDKTRILEIKLNGNELHIPPIVFDGFISSVLLNCVAFEQLSMNCPNDITSYVVFMGCLMNDEADATYLSERGIIENYFGYGTEVSEFFKNICKDVAFDINKSYLKEEFEAINKYTSNRWNVERARFNHLHFDSPWTLLSSIVVLVAILLSITQTTLGVLKYIYS